MSRPTSLVLILVGIGMSILGFIFGEPYNRRAGFQGQLEDMPIFGIQALQFKWVLAVSVCLVLIGIYFYVIAKLKS